ncbi:sushi, von Willebrand factor type A, EGF and pentraxin domain-containing protein 1-like [Argopecten irradians]|uniref:sushi, von Willebrand factor type A, EGF and pentraxin domain-containing protein 1-like n=1 Tax=Argopecten irradians TaxID=31199 RepID=UPI003715420A
MTKITKLLLLLYISPVTLGIHQDLSQFLQDSYLSKTGYWSRNGTSLHRCARYCGMDTGCKSFTFNKTDLRCRLIEDDANSAPQYFGFELNCVYGDRSSVISNSLMGPCRDHSCPNYTSCVPLSSGSSVCVVTACGPTIEPSHRGQGYSYDNSDTMTSVGVKRYMYCDTGYIGYRSVTCLANGNWSETNDHCTDCGSPPSVSNAVIAPGDTTIGSNRTFQCRPTFTASGSGNILCQANGDWSEASLECIPDCVIVSPIQNAVTTATAAPAGSTITYTCDTGYTHVSGTGTRFCNSQGIWQTLDITCNPVYCGDPGWPPGVTGMSYGSLSYQGVVSYSCDSSYTSTNPGSMQVTCQSDGSWSSPQFQCL